MRRRLIATLWWAGIFTVAVGFTFASAQGSPGARDAQRQPAPSGAQSPDHDFVAQVAMANMAAIQLGHMATKKTQNADVHKLAETTVGDHLKAQQRLADAAYGAGIKWPTRLDDKHQQLHQRLSKLSTEQFDREYVKATIDGHRDVEKVLAARVGANSGGAPARSQSDESSLSAKVNQWAAATLPEVRDHLKEAEQVFADLGKAE
jgi:predicted outer membrane protein